MSIIQFLLLLGFLTAAVDDGIAIDPHGGGRTAQADDGNGFDPHGNPRPTAGSCIDPNGGCIDGGGAMDPNG